MSKEIEILTKEIEKLKITMKILNDNNDILRDLIHSQEKRLDEIKQYLIVNYKQYENIEIEKTFNKMDTDLKIDDFVIKKNKYKRGL